MTSMDRTATDGRAARLLAVLALLLGLLAMHGLVTGHHSSGAAASPVSVVATTVQQHPAAVLGLAGAEQVGTQPHTPAHTAGLAAALAGAPSDGALRSPCTDCPGDGVVALCLSVLSAGLALLARLLARRARAAGLPAPQGRLPLLRPGRLPFPRPPDLVAGLCVSRT